MCGCVVCVVACTGGVGVGEESEGSTQARVDACEVNVAVDDAEHKAE